MLKTAYIAIIAAFILSFLIVLTMRLTQPSPVVPEAEDLPEYYDFGG